MSVFVFPKVLLFRLQRIFLVDGVGQVKVLWLKIAFFDGPMINKSDFDLQIMQPYVYMHSDNM